MNATTWTRTFLITLFVAIPRVGHPVNIPAMEWFRQFGSSQNDFTYGVSLDANGNVYAAGSTSGSLDGSPPTSIDAFVRKFTSDGQTLWTRQLRTSSPNFFNSASAVAADSLGRVWIAGVTTGDYVGEAHPGDRDGFIACYDGSGNQLLVTELGGDPASNWDEMYDVATDSAGNAFIAGMLRGDSNARFDHSDAYVTKYGASLNPIASRTIDSGERESASSVAVDHDGNLYIGGSTNGTLAGSTQGSFDAFIRKYNANNNIVWTYQFGSTELDGVEELAVDSLGNLLVVGSSNGSVDGPYLGVRDLFLRKYDPAGNMLWKKQFGTPELEEASGIGSDAAGNIYVAGTTKGNLSGAVGDGDAFIRKYDPSGNLLWSYQFGTPTYDSLTAISVTPDGAIYAVGFLSTSFNGEPLAGGADSFITKIVEVSEPTSAIFAAVAIAIASVYASRTQRC